jgi:hypothetical protein
MKQEWPIIDKCVVCKDAPYNSPPYICPNCNSYYQITQEINRLRAELAQARVELSRERTGQTCGHCLRFIESSRDGTSYCQACADDAVTVAHLRAELVQARADIEQERNNNVVLTSHLEIARLDAGCMRAELAQAQAESDLFASCLQRACKLWRGRYPDAHFLPDGAENLAWCLEELDRVRADIERENAQLQQSKAWSRTWKKMAKWYNHYWRRGVHIETVEFADEKKAE